MIEYSGVCVNVGAHDVPCLRFCKDQAGDAKGLAMRLRGQIQPEAVTLLCVCPPHSDETVTPPQRRMGLTTGRSKVKRAYACVVQDTGKCPLLSCSPATCHVLALPVRTTRYPAACSLAHSLLLQYLCVAPVLRSPSSTSWPASVSSARMPGCGRVEPDVEFTKRTLLVHSTLLPLSRHTRLPYSTASGLACGTENANMQGTHGVSAAVVGGRVTSLALAALKHLPR